MPSYSPTPYESVAAASQTAALHPKFPRRLAHQYLKHVVIASAPVVFSTLGLTLSVTVPPQGHLVGTAPFASNRSALPKLPPTIIRTASTRSVVASHVTHTAVLRCASSNTFTRHPLPLLVNPLTTFLFDKVCLSHFYLRVLLFQSPTACLCERLCSPQPRFLSVLRILPSSHSFCSWLKASPCAFSSEAPSSNNIFHAIRLYRSFAVGHIAPVIAPNGIVRETNAPVNTFLYAIREEYFGKKDSWLEEY